MSDFVAHCCDLLGSLGPVRARAMMGGHLLYARGLPVALVWEDQLFLKTDAASREAFRAAGGEPFTYELRGRVVEMSYWTPPDSALDDPESMAEWAERALEAALRVRSAKARPRRRATAARGTSGTRRPPRGRTRS